MIATTLLMFAISTTLWALDIADLMIPVQLLYEMTNAIPKFRDSDVNQWRFFAQTILYTFEVSNNGLPIDALNFVEVHHWGCRCCMESIRALRIQEARFNTVGRHARSFPRYVCTL